MAMKVEKPLFDGELLDRLLAGRDPKTVLESDGLIGDLKKALAERMLNADGRSPGARRGASRRQSP